MSYSLFCICFLQMFYLGSLLGLYFPYDFCLYPNATAVEVYAIKYIPFIVALVICTIFGVLTRSVLFNLVTLLNIAHTLHCNEVWHALSCRCFARERLNFSGIWLIATLLINPAILTSFAILRCPGVQKEDGRWMSVCMMLCMCFHIQVVVFMLWLQYCPSWLTIHSNNCANVEFP